MTEKRFNLWDIEGTTFIEDHKKGSYHIGKTEDVDINSLRNITKRLNIYADENEQLKKALVELKEIGDYQEGRIKELFNENEQLKSEIKGMEELLKSYRKTIKHDAELLADATKNGYLPPLGEWEEVEK